MSYRIRLAFENPLVDKFGVATSYFQRWFTTFLQSVALAGLPVATLTWSPGLIPNGGSSSATIAVTGAAFGDFVLVSYDKLLAAGLVITANVSAADTVRVTIANNSGVGVTPADGTVSVSVLKRVNQ